MATPFHIRPVGVGVSEMMRQMNENLIVKANKSWATQVKDQAAV